MASEALGMYGVPSFYPTPPALADQLLSRITIRPTDTILEPHGGAGHLAWEIKARYPHNRLLVIEKDPMLRARLLLDGFMVIDTDFLQYRGHVDAIVMNPPFSNNYQDIDHFCHAWRVADKVVSLMHEYSGFTKVGSTRYKPSVFQKWLDLKGISREMTPEDSFMDSDFPSHVRTCIVWGKHA